MNSLHSLLAITASVGEKILLYNVYGEWKIMCQCTGTVAFESCLELFFLCFDKRSNAAFFLRSLAPQEEEVEDGRGQIGD